MVKLPSFNLCFVCSVQYCILKVFTRDSPGQLVLVVQHPPAVAKLLLEQHTCLLSQSLGFRKLAAAKLAVINVMVADGPGFSGSHPAEQADFSILFQEEFRTSR